MMPALTAANLLAWSVQVGVIVLVGGVSLHAARLQSPRVRLACFRALLVVCFVLPFVQPLGLPEPTGAGGPASLRSGSVGTELQLGATEPGLGATEPGLGAVSADVTPASASAERAAALRNASRPWLPGWAVSTAIIILGLGIAARLAWLLVGLMALRRLRREATRPACPGLKAGTHGDGRFRALARDDSRDETSRTIDRAIDLAGARADVLRSRAVRHPVTFGLLRPVVLLPDSYASLDETEQVAVLCHEFLHVRRYDWLHTVVEEILRAVLWFHPGIWWLLGQIDLSREQLVDQEVVALTECRQSYLKALVTLTVTPAGPILRPASLFLGRAHLLQRVALLSREVRMSRPRLVASLVVIAVALVLGGRFVVQAFPLAQASPATIAAPSVPAGAPGAVAPSVNAPVTPAPEASSARADSPAPTADEPQANPTQSAYPRVVQRVEPMVPAPSGSPGEDAIVIMPVTIGVAGDVARITQVVGVPSGFQMGAGSPEAFQRMLNAGQNMAGWPQEVTDRMRAAYDAARMWRFEPLPAPVATVIGFNLARTEQSGVETEPVRIGGSIAQPKRVKNVLPEYPAEAQGKGIQGVVILEMTLDGAGIPITACALRPVESLTMPAIKAALQWRYEPDADYSRRLMTVTVNFSLASNNVAGVASGVQGGVSGSTVGGVQGGVAGGVTGGIVGGAPGVPPPPPPPPTGFGGASSFGPPRSEWPQFVRVGGEIKQPTRIVNVQPVYPREAQDARVQGVVIIEVLVGSDGTVQAGRILRSIPLLDQPALDAVRQWEFTPTLLNGTPVAIVMTVTVNFTLQ